jgi:hypothetical protein
LARLADDVTDFESQPCFSAVIRLFMASRPNALIG